MITRDEMQKALLNKYKSEIMARVAGYEKKVKSLVDSALEAEYNMVILGKQPKVERKVWKKE